MNEVIERTELEQGELNGTPGFYKSVSGQAVAEVFKNRQTVYKDIMRFKSVKTIEVEVPAAQMIGFNIIPGFGNVSEDHGVRRNTPLVYFNHQIYGVNVVIPAPTANEETFSTTIINYGFSVQNIELEAFIYEVLKKN